MNGEGPAPGYVGGPGGAGEGRGHVRMPARAPVATNACHYSC